MTGIYYDYIWYIPRLLCVSIHCGFIAKETMKPPPQIRSSMHRCIPRRGTAHDPHQTSPTHVLLSIHIWQVYARYMHVISFNWTLPSPLQLHGAFGPAGSPKRAGTCQTWTFCGSFRFWRPKAPQLEAGACPSSTTRCWSHRHGCPCVIPCLRRLHTRIRRPASVEQCTYMELWRWHCHEESTERVAPAHLIFGYAIYKFWIIHS